MEIGRAFANALIPSIQNGAVGLIELCAAHLKLIPDSSKKILMREPDTQAGGPSTDAIVAYGLTPIHIVLAADAIALWVERAIDAGFFPENRVVLRYNNDLSAIATPGCHSGFTIYDVVSEISGFAEITPITSGILFHWLIDIAEFLPYIFVGFLATKTKNGEVLLTQLPENQQQKDLFTRWSKQTS